MAENLFSYELSQEADNDIEEIYDYTLATFGAEQAIKYILGIEDLLSTLCAHPQTGRTRNEIKNGLRSQTYVSHTVFYRVMENRIKVVRVLHASRDIPKFL